MLGSGKTTLALKDLEREPRVLIYSPGVSNDGLKAYPYIYDTPDYLQHWPKWLEQNPRLRIEKRVSPSTLFHLLTYVRQRVILLDDVTALKTTPQERSDFEAFLRTVRFNGNRLILTTHRAIKDVPPLVQIIGTSFYWVGPGTRHRREIDVLYSLVNYPISYADFCAGVERCKKFESFPIRRAS